MKYNIFASRTFYTLLAMFVVGGLNAVIPVIPPTYAALVQALLMAFGAYFHLDAVKTAGNVRR